MLAMPNATTARDVALSLARSGSLIGGCNGTQYGCCTYPIGQLPRLSQFDSCRSQNCTVCRDAVECLSEISEPMLNATAGVLGYIHEICSTIVGRQAKQCVAVIDAALDAIGLIERGLNASQVCNLLGFCNNATSSSTVRG